MIYNLSESEKWGLANFPEFQIIYLFFLEKKKFKKHNILENAESQPGKNDIKHKCRNWLSRQVRVIAMIG